MAKIPDKCKYLETCSRSIDAGHYEHICSTENWIHCDWIRAEDIRPYQKTPKEWRKEVP